ncbi:MAG: Molybdenum-containing formylmethanofuran dehydrogenase 1 subunit C [Methanonatronarchaeales archaeon]|nr:Molybdenum-containing formylmethanofuran dehydrogenase 1 subunit C [Methanonatronarchaeales archaeon]
MKTIDCGENEVRAVNHELKSLDDGASAEITNPDGTHFLCAGLRNGLDVEIDGSAGYFLGTMNENARVVADGNAGNHPGDNMTGGLVRVKGSAGDGAGQGMYGGTLVVEGDAGARTGQIMKGGTVIVGGFSDFMTGLYMMGGELVVLGDLGDKAGASMIRGTIYVAGDVASLGNNAELVDVTEEDEQRLEQVLTENGYEMQGFRKIVPISDRPFYGEEEEDVPEG